jgi:polysaccharide biosynthesis transport protein
VAVVAAFGYSKIKSPSYQSTSLVEISTTATATGTGTAAGASVTLPDPVQELSSTAVEISAAKLLKDPDVNAVADSVTGTVDTTTGALTITGTGSSAERAQAVTKAYSDAFVDQIQSLVQAQIDKFSAEVITLQAKITALSAGTGALTNQAQITAYNDTVATLLAEQYNIQSGEPYATTEVAANLPTSPSGLSKSKLLGIGFLAGLLVGIGIALVREQFDNRLRTSPDVESITSAPILAELPYDTEVRTGRVAISLVQATQSQMAEAIRELRTSLRVIFEEVPCPLVVVTSPEAGDGKTFVAANLAAAWAMSGSKVIAVSADFRRPRLEEIFGLQATGLPGLADLIRSNWKSPENDDRLAASREAAEADNDDDSSSDDHDGGSASRTASSRERSSRQKHASQEDELSVQSLLIETGIWGLQVLPAGTQLDSPSELFGSPGIRPVLAQLPMLADVVIFDTPPVLPVPDTAIIGRMADGVVVVASEGRTDRHNLERTVNRLETTQCRVLGVALNRVRRSSSEPYPSYAYTYTQ